ncbi:hypothetical protein DSBG_4307 [Desulfosporosinus sp. BG]|nr:hypothetical protein DSBG_4307 [Desulfosporosinus sp. BG]
MNNNYFARFMNLLVFIFIVIMAFVLPTLPILVKRYLEYAGNHTLNALWITFFLYLTAIPFVVLLLMAKKLCNNVLRQEPFSHSSVTLLNIISICAFADFFLYAIGTFAVLKNLLSLTVMVAAFMVGLVGQILIQLVKHAMELKQENDLTI